MVMVLYGRSCDPVLQYFCHYLQEQQQIVVFIDQDQLGKNIIFDQHYWYWQDGTRLAHCDITAVFNRSASLHPGISYTWQQTRYHMRVLSWLDYECPLVLNRPRAMMSNSSKPYQSWQVAPYGLHMPRYACLANVRMLSAEEPMIAKSISSVRSVVRAYTHQTDQYVQEPVLFQSYIRGDNIRVHVVGEQLIAIRIQSSDVDYRYAEATRYTAEVLPATVHNTCIKIAHGLGLDFCGIDLIHGEEGYSFLEANPAPGYNAFERHISGFPISEALLQLMQQGVESDLAA